ncbi:MAG: response regulator [Pacificimonas sp.]|jgi:DNA-binding response OmpR family regulator|nr:response regulator [Pacificimonas sp.]
MTDGSAKTRILIAEDNALVLMSLEALAEDMGWDVVGPAMTLTEAVALARDSEADLALLDVNLNGERSVPVAEILKQRGVPVIFATGYGDDIGLPDSLAGTPVVSKPFSLDALEAMLRAHAPTG